MNIYKITTTANRAIFISVAPDVDKKRITGMLLYLSIDVKELELVGPCFLTLTGSSVIQGEDWEDQLEAARAQPRTEMKILLSSELVGSMPIQASVANSLVK